VPLPRGRAVFMTTQEPKSVAAAHLSRWAYQRWAVRSDVSIAKTRPWSGCAGPPARPLDTGLALAPRSRSGTSWCFGAGPRRSAPLQVRTVPPRVAMTADGGQFLAEIGVSSELNPAPYARPTCSKRSGRADRCSVGPGGPPRASHVVGHQRISSRQRASLRALSPPTPGGCPAALPWSPYFPSRSPSSTSEGTADYSNAPDRSDGRQTR